MTNKVTMVARRAFPRRDQNGDGVRRVQPGEIITATEAEAKALTTAGKATRKPAEPAAKKEG